MYFNSKGQISVSVNVLFFYRISGTASMSCPNLTSAVCFQIFQKPLQPDMGHNSLANFQIEKKIGRGQFSEVYQARYLLGNTSVALKKVQVIRIELISFFGDNMQIHRLHWLACMCTHQQRIWCSASSTRSHKSLTNGYICYTVVKHL